MFDIETIIFSRIFFLDLEPLKPWISSTFIKDKIILNQIKVVKFVSNEPNNQFRKCL